MFVQKSSDYPLNFLLHLLSPQHHSPSSSSSSDSYDSDYDRPERPKNRKSLGSSRESDGLSSQVSSPPLSCSCQTLTCEFRCDSFLLYWWPISMDGIRRETTASRHLTRAEILTNTATTAMTNMTTTKRKTITTTTCPGIHSQRLSSVRGRDGI